MSNIINNFNDILNKFSFSLKKDGYKILDNISEIDINIFNREPIKTLCLDKNISVFILILNTLISAIILYYFFKCVLSLYSDTNISNIYYFVIKVILVAILSFNSIYICKEVININSLFSKIMGIFLEEVCENEINFDFLDDNISTLDGVFETTDKVGLNGLKDMVVCTYITGLIIFLSIRYVIVILCIILSPFAFICLLNSRLKELFYIWVKLFTYNLAVQTVNKIIIFIPIAGKKEKDIYIAILIGSILLMFKLYNIIGDIKIYGKNK